VLFDHTRQFFTYKKLPNGASRLTSISNPRPLFLLPLVSFGWNDQGYLTSTTDASGLTTTFVPLPGGAPREEHRPDGSLARYEYERGVLSRTSLDDAVPTRVVTSLDPDAAGRPGHGIGPFGEVTDWTWATGLNRIDHLTRANDLKTETVTFAYDGFGQLVDATNGQRHTHYDHDPQGFARRVSEFALDRSAPPIDPGAFDQPGSLITVRGRGPVAVTCSHYGPSGRYLDTVLPDGTTLHFTYDGEAHVIRVDAEPHTGASADWDHGCPLYKGTRPATGTLEAFTYDLSGQPTSVTDGRGKATTIVNDGYGNPAIITDAAGAVTRRGFDQAGNLIWTASYGPGQAPDAYGPPVRGQVGLLAASELDYDGPGRLHVRRDWHFDKAGQDIGDGVATTTFDYDIAHRKVTVSDDAGHRTVYEQDGAGRPTRTTFATGGTDVREYAPGNRFIRHTVSAPTASGVVTELLRLTTWGAPAAVIKNPPANVSVPRDFGDLEDFAELEGALRVVLDQAWAYDEHKRLSLTRDAGGLVRTLTYDALDRTRTDTSAYDPARPPEVITNQWSPGGLLLSRTSDVGGARVATTTFDYDSLGRLRRTERPEGVAETRDYASASQLVSRFVDGRNVAVKMGYTPTGFVSSIAAVRATDELPGAGPPSDSNILATCSIKGSADCAFKLFERDPLGRILSATVQTVRSVLGKPQVRDRIVTSFDWDSLGNRAREANDLIGSDLAVAHAYDGLGQPISSTIGDQTVSRTFDGIGRLSTVTLGDDSSAEPSVRFGYRAGLGGPTSRTLASGISTDYGYDVLGRLDRQSDRRDLAFLVRWRWEMPADGVPRLAGLRRGRGAERASLFQVDRGGRLVSEATDLAGLEGLTVPPTSARVTGNALMANALGGHRAERRYTLDGRANWVDFDVTGRVDHEPVLNLLDQYTSFEGEPASYLRNGALATLGGETYSYDLFGNLSTTDKGGGTRRHRYDALDRLVQATDSDGGNPALYGWDGQRRVIQKTLLGTNITVDGQGLDEHLMLLRQGTAIIIGNPGCTNIDCLLDGHIPLRVQATTTLPLYYHQERAGSPYMVTDSSGAVVELYDFRAYGEMAIHDGHGNSVEASTVENAFGYQGQAFDPFTGLVNMRARWYRPEWGRFIAPDPLGLAAGSNLFAFVESAPLRYTDPLGLTRTQPTWAQRLTSNFWQQQLQGAYNQTFGPGTGVLGRASGLVSYVAATPVALAEQITNGGGAFVGNLVDQYTLRSQGRFAEADQAADAAGRQIQTSLLSTTVTSAVVGVLGRAAAATVVTIDATGAVPAVATEAEQWVTPDRFEGVRQLSQTLRQAGVPRPDRLLVIRSFVDITMRVAQGGENVLRFYGGASPALGRFVTPTFLQGNVRSLLALPPSNTMQGMTQFLLQPRTIFFEGIAAPDFGLPGGGLQYFVPSLQGLAPVGGP
jgi:RHS repeat-associated protein